MQSNPLKIRSSSKKRIGRPRKSDTWTPEILRERAQRYFAICDARKVKILTKAGDIVEVPRPAPYTMAGLCSYLGIPRAQFRAWMTDEKLGDSAVMVHQIVVDNRVSGALDGSQNAGFAQYDLKNIDPENYQDKTQVEQSVDPALGGILERSLAAWLPKD